MSRTLLIAAAVLVLFGFALAFLAPTGNMGAQEAFYARLLVLIPALFCGLILFGFSAVVGAIGRLENQGEQLRLLLATRGEASVPRNAIGKRLLALEEDAEEEEPPPVTIFGKAAQRVPQRGAAVMHDEPADDLHVATAEQEVNIPPLRAAPPPFAPPQPSPMSAPLREDPLPEPSPKLDTSFLERALRQTMAQEQPAAEPAHPSTLEKSAERIIAAPAVAPPPEPQAPPPSLSIAVPPARPFSELPPPPEPAPSTPAPVPPAISPVAPPLMAAPAEPPSQPPPASIMAQAEPTPSRVPTIAELLERDLERWNEAAPVEKPKPRLVREGQFAGRTYRTYEDGSLEIDTEQSTLRFDSLDEFRTFVASSGQ